MSSQEPVKSFLPGMSPREFAVFIGFLRLHTVFVRGLDAELQAAHGLPLTAFEVMNWLAYAPERRMRMSVLANSVFLSLSGITRLVERLEREGLVAREPSPDDRRGFYAVLTDAGLARLEAARPTHETGIRRRLLDHLSDEEIDTLHALWHRLIAAQTPEPGGPGVGGSLPGCQEE